MKKSKFLITIFLILTILLSFATISYGFGVNDLSGNQSKIDSNLKKSGNSLVRVISTIGVVVSVVALIAIGIKYMMGSAEERAEYKKSLLPYTIGAGLVFAASTFAQLIYDLAIKL